MKHIDSVNQLKLSRSNALCIPWQVQVDRAPSHGQIRIVFYHFSLTAATEERVRFRNEVAFNFWQEPAFIQTALQDFALLVEWMSDQRPKSRPPSYLLRRLSCRY